MIRLTQVSFIFLMIFIFSLCSPSPDPVPDNPVPALTSISPTSKVSHMPDFTLTAIGTNFVSGSRIIFNGASKPTTYVSPTEVTCQVGPTDITANLSIVYDYEDLSGALSSNVPVLVNNPAPGGGDSNSVNFTINDNHTFYVPGNISNNAGSSRHPAIAVDSAGNINVVWRDNTDILFSHSTDGGSSWSAAVNISNNSGDSYKPAITVDSAGNINVAWHDISPGNWDIFFSRSTDSGSSWSAAVNISNNSGHSLKPAIIVDSAGNINVAWYDYTPGNYDIFFRHSTDNGSSWSAAVNISNNSVYSSYPAITVDSAGNINVAWYDYTPGNYDIFFRRSTDSGSSWSAAVNISNNSGDSYNPAITVDSAGNINAAWQDKTAGNQEIFFSRSTDSGSSWSAAVNISNNSGYSYTPAITVDSAGNINIVWYDYSPGDSEIFFSRSTDNGAAWSAVINISNNSGDSYYSAITVDSTGNINIVWYDVTPGNYDIFFTGSTR